MTAGEAKRARKSRVFARRHRGMPDRKAAHVHFEDDRLFPGGARVTVVVPGEGVFNDPAFRYYSGRCHDDRTTGLPAD